MSNESSDDEKVGGLINAGGDIAGSVIGSAMGFLIGGPAGAVLGGASGPLASAAIKKVGLEASERLLGPREKVRIGGTLAIAAAHISARIERGENLRTDGFFENSRNGRSDAEEVAESVLLKAQKEPEELKVPHMALMIGNISFDSSISPHLAHQLVKTMESLTYRQLCILKMVAFPNNYSLRGSDYRGQSSFERNLYEVLYECTDLATRSLINVGGSVTFGPTDIKPSAMRIQGMGADLFNMSGLAKIPELQITPITKVLGS